MEASASAISLELSDCCFSLCLCLQRLGHLVRLHKLLLQLPDGLPQLDDIRVICEVLRQLCGQ